METTRASVPTFLTEELLETDADMWRTRVLHVLPVKNNARVPIPRV